MSLSTQASTIMVDLINDRPVRLGTHLYILEDPEGQLSPFEIQSPALADQWYKNPHSRLSRGYDGTVVWLRFHLDASQSIHKEWDLVVANPLLEYLDLYQIFEGSGPRLIYRGGMSRPFNNRSQDHRYFIMPVSVYQPTTFLLRLESSPLTSTAITAYPENQFWTPLQQADIGNWLFYGVVLAMIFYNLFLYSTVRDFSYLYYVFFVLSFGILHLSIDGYLYQYFWPRNQGFDFRVQFWIAQLIVIFGGLFVTHFLGLRKLAPRLFWAVMLVLVLQPVGFVLSFFIPADVFSLWLAIGLIGLLLFAVGIGIYAWQKGLLAAKFFVLAWVLFALGNILYLAMQGGWVDLDFNPILASKTGGFAETMLLSFALAHRIRVLRDDRERARMRAEAQSQFLAQISHEIRTPLNGVLGMTEVLGRTRLDNEQREYVEIIQGSGESLMSLINDILDYSKLEAGKMVLHPDRINPVSVTEQQINLFLAQAERKSLSMELNVAEDVPQKVILDVQRLRQILSNLISNAVKYTDQGRIDITLSLLRSPHTQLKWRIKDTGIGIPPEALSTLFTLYHQVSMNRQSWVEGTGLGLAISRDLVELMGGEITVQSEPGKGTEFQFVLPFDNYSVAETSRNTSIHPNERQSPLRILVAEDNIVNQRVIQGLLEKMGHKVGMVSNGREVVDLFKQDDFNYDVILMDCEMPELDGYGATEAIRKIEHEAMKLPIPIIALTAHAMEDVQQRCLATGMNDFLTKPINSRRLARVLGSL